MIPSNRVDECIYVMSLAISDAPAEIATAVFSALGYILEMEEISEEQARDLAHVLCFEKGINASVVTAVVGRSEYPVADWLTEDGGRQQIGTYKSMPYPDYLRTEHWRHVRHIALLGSQFQCRLCNSPDNLEVHHRTYERRGEEARVDLVALCRACHEMFHVNRKLALPEG